MNVHKRHAVEHNLIKHNNKSYYSYYFKACNKQFSNLYLKDDRDVIRLVQWTGGPPGPWPDPAASGRRCTVDGRETSGFPNQLLF